MYLYAVSGVVVKFYDVHDELEIKSNDAFVHGMSLNQVDWREVIEKHEGDGDAFELQRWTPLEIKVDLAVETAFVIAH